MKAGERHKQKDKQTYIYGQMDIYIDRQKGRKKERKKEKPKKKKKIHRQRQRLHKQIERLTDKQ